MNNFWTKEEDDILKNVYLTKLSAKDLEKCFPGRTYFAIRSRANLLGLKRHIAYTKNENFFDEPNELNCSIAGILASDGCITKAKKDNYEFYRIHLNLCTKDKDYLNDIKEILGYNGKIYDYVKKDFVIKTLRSSTYPITVYTSSLTICNVFHWVKKLKEHWNIIPRKSLILQPPNITDLNLCLSYIQGIICGDGNISIAKHKNGYQLLLINHWGTKDLLNWIKEVYEKFLKTKLKCTVRKEREDSKIYHLVVSGANAIKLVNKMKTLNCVFLNRKWNNPELLEYLERDINSFKILKYWTPEEDEKLKNLVQLNKTYKEIGKIMNRSPGSCRAYAFRKFRGKSFIKNKSF